MLMPFTGDFRGLEHVLSHEMVHEFQFDIFARGRAGGGIAQLSQVNPPLWFMEGMAEYLSLGPDYARSATVMRDAAINGDLPTIVKDDRAAGPLRSVPLRPAALGVQLRADLATRSSARSWPTFRPWASSARSSARPVSRSRISAMSGRKRCR